MVPILLAKTISLYGLAFYLSIAIVNNSVDKETNTFFLKQMFQMVLLKDESLIGRGIIHRAVKRESFSKYILRIILCCQLIIALMLWISAVKFSIVFLGYAPLISAVNMATYALSAFLALWFFFWCGGFWFVYWIKTPQIQEVHMKLIILSIVEIIFINL